MANLLHILNGIWQEEFYQEKKEQRIDHLYFMSITFLEYIQDMKTQSLTSTFIFNMKKSFKSVLMEDTKECWVMMLVEEGLTMNCLLWTIHQRRASEWFDIEIPNVMEKGKWVFKFEVSS
jgi:hypothetical protein